jgi:flagellar assembly protein FliH
MRCLSSVIKAEFVGESPVLNGYTYIWPQVNTASEIRRVPDPAQELARARRKADAVIASARQEAEKMRQEGFVEGKAAGRRQGFEEGQERGFQAGMAEAADILRAARDVLAAAERAKAEALAAASPEIVELALAIAGKLVHKEIAGDPDYLPRLVSDALERLSESKTVTVRVSARHPGQAESVAALNELAEGIQVQIDEQLAPGDCVVETEEGLLDGRLSVRLKSIRQALAGDTE